MNATYCFLLFQYWKGNFVIWKVASFFYDVEKGIAILDACLCLLCHYSYDCSLHNLYAIYFLFYCHFIHQCYQYLYMFIICTVATRLMYFFYMMYSSFLIPLCAELRLYFLFILRGYSSCGSALLYLIKYDDWNGFTEGDISCICFSWFCSTFNFCFVTIAGHIFVLYTLFSHFFAQFGNQGARLLIC